MQNDTDKQARNGTEGAGAPEPDKLTAAGAADEGADWLRVDV